MQCNVKNNIYFQFEYKDLSTIVLSDKLSNLHHVEQVFKINLLNCIQTMEASRNPGRPESAVAQQG